MALKALLTVDLNGVTTEQRRIFNEKLKKEKWSKLKDLTTAWRATFTEDVTTSAALRITKKDVVAAVNEAEIEDYKAAVHFGEEYPEKF